MLREWIQNIPLTTVLEILSHQRTVSVSLWRLAKEEYDRRLAKELYAFVPRGNLIRG